MTGYLNATADWLLECGVDTVALESTGVYWIPLYEVLEQNGLRVWLVAIATGLEAFSTWVRNKIRCLPGGEKDHNEFSRKEVKAAGKTGKGINRTTFDLYRLNINMM